MVNISQDGLEISGLVDSVEKSSEGDIFVSVNNKIISPSISRK